ncbi:MAG: hypothetical protein DWQ30_25745 [Acidobacteria bacterium]|nr:MAG: hypothetical protein DWQ30_25745 [Acidobacteriota bacterium]
MSGDGGRFELDAGSRAAPRRRGTGRIALRVVLLGIIVALAYLRQPSQSQMLGLVLAIAWALLLPLVLRGVWRVTTGRAAAARYVSLAIAAVVLLLAFAFGVRPLLTL